MRYVYARECAVASSELPGRQSAELIRVLPSSALAKWRPVGYSSGLDGSFGETGRRQPYGGGEKGRRRFSAGDCGCRTG